jgi:hypothetical protein
MNRYSCANRSNLDAHIRRRLRALLLRQWKRRRVIVRRLIRMGARSRTALRVVKGVHLFGARQARFVKDVQPPLIGCRRFLLAGCEMILQRARLDASLGQLVRRT